MAYNQIVINGATVLDLTQDSVTPDKMQQGITAHNAAGETITGTRVSSTSLEPPNPAEASDANGNTQIVAMTTVMINGSSNAYSIGSTKITIPIAGTYTIRWAGYKYTSRNTAKCALYKNGTQVSGSETTLTEYSLTVCAQVVQCAAGDQIAPGAYGTSAIAGWLRVSCAWDIGAGSDSESYSG